MGISDFTKEEAENFLSKVFSGKHHIPSEIRPYGDGWFIWTHYPLSTFDFSLLTRLVVLAHDELVRVEIGTHYFHGVKIILHKRYGRDSSLWSISERHPTIEEGILMARNGTGGR